MSAAPQLALVPRMPEQWLTADQVMKLMNWSRATFYRRSAELISRNKPDGLNARPLREYLAASLPLSPTQAEQTQLTVVAPPAASFGPLFAGIPATGAQRIMLPDPEAQKQAEQRLAVLSPLLDYAANAERLSSLTLPDGRRVTSLTRLIEHIAVTHEPPISIRTVKDWLARYRADGLVGLADRIRSDKGQSRWFARNRDAAILAAYLHLGDIDRQGLTASEKPHRGQSIAFIYEQLCERAESLGIAEGELPSRETVRIFLADSISPAMKALAREGKRQYRERMSPYIRRRYDDIYANQVWVGDQMEHDAEVTNDGIFDDVPLGTPLRLRLDAFEDYRSRKIVGATWTHFGSSRSIAATLRRAILQFGPPEMIYVDNGKDYKKVAKGAQRGFPVQDLRPEDLVPIEQCGFLARIGAGVTHCIPRHPQSKGVERCFGTVHHFDAFFSTYTSGQTATRPEATGELMMQHRRLFKAGRVAESKHPLASRFILACLAWIEKYNNTPHSGEGMDGLSPNEVFEAEFNPNQKPTPEPATLAMLMAEYERREVRECAVTLNKRRYMARPEDRLAWAAMHEANEREILIAYDPCDPESAAALDLDGRFIAWLEAETLLRFAPADPETRRQIGESMEIRRGLEKATKNSIRAIAAAARNNGAQSAEEMAYSQLQLPAATSPVISQRAPRLRPDKTAVAPASASDIAASFLEGLK
jgi:hypothetical protein